MTPDVYRENLLQLFRTETTPEDIAAGVVWYPNARAIVRQWSREFSLPIAVVANVIAGLSPQCEWTRNLIAAENVLSGYPAGWGPLHGNVAKVQRLLGERGTDIRVYFPHGPKVYAFSRNLAGSNRVVTVDTHAVQACHLDACLRLTIRERTYPLFARGYVLAAHDVQMMPATFQAVIWHTWKRLYPRKQHLRQEFV